MTVRTEAQLAALYADNFTGNIGAGDLRDLVDTLFQDRTHRAYGHQFAPTTGSGKPTPGTVGATNYLSFDVGDAAYYTFVVPENQTDSDEDIIISIDWTPAAAEAGKVVSWQLEYVLLESPATKTLDTIDATLNATDEAVPTTQWEETSTGLTIPAAEIGDAHIEIHTKLTRVASSSDPSTSPVVTNVYADIILRWPGAT